MIRGNTLNASPRRHGALRLAVILAVSIAASFLPFGGVIGYPLALLSTWAHEASHGITMLLTGAGFASLDVYTDTSGLAHPAQGAGTLATAVIAFAGYFGTALLAGILVAAGRRPNAVRPALVAVGAAMLATVALVGGLVTGRLIVGLIGLAVITAAFAPLKVRAVVLDVIAVQLGLNAFVSIWVLFGTAGYVNGRPARSDADLLASTFFGPAVLWAVLWVVADVAILGLALWVRLSPDRQRRSLRDDPLAVRDLQ